MQLNIVTFIIMMIYLPLIYQLLKDETDSLHSMITDYCDLGTWVVTAT